ncbi:hypothetical protein DENSPDRAFT_563494 [Dentipellis sp. KUC8613]|nr:hypothetical protein DENSPDRAFT_563494 [Dentipellis sp. KUC8613]
MEAGETLPGDCLFIGLNVKTLQAKSVYSRDMLLAKDFQCVAIHYRDYARFGNVTFCSFLNILNSRQS